MSNLSPSPNVTICLLLITNAQSSPEVQIRLEAARTWSVWEASTSRLLLDPELMQKFGSSHFADAFARIECHYFINKGFFESEEQLLLNVDRIRHIRAVIVQGRYDVVCPMISAWELHRVWPEAEFIIVPDAGQTIARSRDSQRFDFSNG